MGDASYVPLADFDPVESRLAETSPFSFAELVEARPEVLSSFRPVASATSLPETPDKRISEEPPIGGPDAAREVPRLHRCEELDGRRPPG